MAKNKIVAEGTFKCVCQVIDPFVSCVFLRVYVISNQSTVDFKP